MPKCTPKTNSAKSPKKKKKKSSAPTPTKPSTASATPAIVKPDTKKPSVFNKMKNEASKALHAVEEAAPKAWDLTKKTGNLALEAVEFVPKLTYHEVVKAADAVEHDLGGLLSSPVSFLRNNMIIFGALAIGGIYFISKANQPALSSLAANAKFIPI